MVKDSRNAPWGRWKGRKRKGGQKGDARRKGRRGGRRGEGGQGGESRKNRAGGSRGDCCTAYVEGEGREEGGNEEMREGVMAWKGKKTLYISYRDRDHPYLQYLLLLLLLFFLLLLLLRRALSMR